MTQSAVERCEEIIGYEFRNKGILDQALTHSSAAPTRLDSNERLEFLGDSVLGLSVCALLFNEHKTLGEGEMTKIKSTVVSRKTCAQIVRKLEVVLHGDAGDLRWQNRSRSAWSEILGHPAEGIARTEKSRHMPGQLVGLFLVLCFVVGALLAAPEAIP